MNYKKAVSIGTLLIFLSSNVAFAGEVIKKDESVFITLDAGGKQKSTIVSDWIHSPSANIDIMDKSSLSSVVNVKGNEAPSVENGFLKWKSDKNDIFYQGTTDKAVPLDVNITYFLNDKEIEPQSIAGKSGKIKINIELKNRESHTANINGKNRTLYTPLTTVAVINLPIENFTDVKASSGEIISDGNNQILTFIGFPGLKESLDLKNDIIDLPSSLTVEATVKDFKMGPIMITSTPKLPDVEGFKDAKNIDELISGVNQLQDAAGKLSDGTSKLADGEKKLSDNLNNLKDGLGKLNSASNELQGGSKKLADGTQALSSGAKAVTDGSAALSGGLGQLSEKSTELSNGLNQLVGSTSHIKSGQDELTQGAKELSAGIKQLKDAKNKELEGVKALSTGVDMLKQLASLLPDGEIKTKLLGGLGAQKQGLDELSNGGQEYLKGLDSLEAGANKLQNGSAELSSYISQLNEGQKKALEGSKKLSEGSSYMASKSKELAGGTEKLNGGLAELNKGANSLNSGIKEYTNGVNTASAGSNMLSEGALQLLNGVNELDFNMKKFKAEGIEKMTGEVKDKVGSIDDLIATKDEIVKLSNNYGTFTGLSDGMEGSVKFIIKTDEIKIKDTNAAPVKEVKEEHKGFVQWIKGIFKK